VTTLNEVSTIGSFIISASILIFMWNFVHSLIHGEVAGNDPWDGSSLEWATTSPPPEYNFAVIPPVLGREAFWALKYPRDASGQPASTPRPWIPVPEEIPHEIHMPRPSYWPVVVALGVFMVLSGFIFSPIESAIGVVLLVAGVCGWAFEPASGEPAHPPRDPVALAETYGRSGSAAR
jgi:cytochrome c oxidase subunit 1